MGHGAWSWIAPAIVVLVIVYGGLIALLWLSGRRTQARAIGGFIPDCIGLFRGLIGDPRVPRRQKVALGILVAYLVSPIDLIPDFLPGIGQLDDAIAVALVLRHVLGHDDGKMLRTHWPGPPESLRTLERLL